MNSFSLDDGKKLIKLAREAIFGDPEKIKKEKKFMEKCGVFVTLYSYPDHQLRGCIGFPYPIKELYYAVIESAKAAAFSDTRFMPVTSNEEEKIIIEVSILTVPELIKVKSPKDYLKKINIGKDGLIIRSGYFSGLLLPIVFIEYNATPEKALEMTCEKAGLPKDAWKDPNCEVYKFQTQVFAELEPNGKIIKKM